MRSCLGGAGLEEACLEEACLGGAGLEEACLKEACLGGACLEEACLGRAFLRQMSVPAARQCGRQAMSAPGSVGVRQCGCQAGVRQAVWAPGR